MDVAHEDEPLLLTPGPVTLSARVKEAMLHDYASGDERLLAELAFCRRYLLELCNGQGSHTTVPIVGSGTSGVEAAIGTFVPRNGKLLIHTNGVYGDRVVEVARKLGVPHASFRTAPFISAGDRNWPFLTFTPRPCMAAACPAATSRSVCRHRNAGICSRSTTRAAGSA